MTTISAIGSGACEGVVDALRAEYGAVLAARILEAEALDFLWEARVHERYLGQHFEVDCDVAGERSRVAIMSFLDGSWRVGVCLIDGEGEAAALLWERACACLGEAKSAFERAV